MFARDGLEAWEVFGRTDPYFGVLNRPRFRNAALEGAEREEFFATGARHVEALFAEIRTSLVPDFSPVRALDFGCGVGRICIPLAREATQVVGVDISPAMLDEARRNCAEARAENVVLVGTTLLDEPCTPFDFIHSYIVLQHIGRKAGLRIIERLLDNLAADGIAALHLVYRAERPLWRTAVHAIRKRVPLMHPLMNLLQRKPPRSPLMHMNTYNLNRVFSVLQRKHCHRVSVRFSDHGGWWGVFLLIQRRSYLDTGIG